MDTIEPLNITEIKCYKCKRYLKQAGHRLHSGWFCVTCWHYITSAGLIQLYENELAPYDWDLARKDNLIQD